MSKPQNATANVEQAVKGNEGGPSVRLALIETLSVAAKAVESVIVVKGLPGPAYAALTRPVNAIRKGIAILAASDDWDA